MTFVATTSILSMIACGYLGAAWGKRTGADLAVKAALLLLAIANLAAAMIASGFVVQR